MGIARENFVGKEQRGAADRFILLSCRYYESYGLDDRIAAETLAVFLDHFQSVENAFAAVDGRLFDTLLERKPAVLAVLAEMHRQGRLRLAATLYYQPAAEFVDAAVMRAQLELSRAAWRQFDITQFSGIWLEDSRSVECWQSEISPAEALELLTPQQFSGVYILPRPGFDFHQALASDCRDDLSQSYRPQWHDVVTDWSNLTAQEVADLPARIAIGENFAANQARLVQAERFLQRSYYRPTRAPLNAFAEKRQERIAWESLLRSCVEIDAIGHTGVEPQHGWLEVSRPTIAGRQLLTLDNPFARLSLDAAAGGGLVELSYKPRKINLAAGGNYGEAAASFNGELLTDAGCRSQSPVAAAAAGEIKIARQSPDQIHLRSELDLSLGAETQFRLVRIFAFRASLGAHLIDATTGFSLEYWLEGSAEPPEELYFRLGSRLMLPSCNLEGLSSRALMCVGAVSEHSQALDAPVTHQRFSVDGGLYGLRLIDGIEHLVIDYRSAHMLYAASTAPLEMEPSAGTSEPPEAQEPVAGNMYLPETASIRAAPIAISLVSTARSLFGFESRNTLFVSIA